MSIHDDHFLRPEASCVWVTRLSVINSKIRRLFFIFLRPELRPYVQSRKRVILKEQLYTNVLQPTKIAISKMFACSDVSEYQRLDIMPSCFSSVVVSWKLDERWMKYRSMYTCSYQLMTYNEKLTLVCTTSFTKWRKNEFEDGKKIRGRYFYYYFVFHAIFVSKNFEDVIVGSYSSLFSVISLSWFEVYCRKSDLKSVCYGWLPTYLT